MSDPREVFTVSVGLLLLRPTSKEVLLGRRCNTGYADGMLSVPSGYVQPGESFTEAMARELHEETGLRIATTDMALGATVKRHDGNAPQIFLLFVTTTAECRGLVLNREPDKCEGWSWYRQPMPYTEIPYFLKIAMGVVKRDCRFAEVPQPWDLYPPPADEGEQPR